MLSFQFHSSLVDIEGRYIVLDCTLDNTRCTILNVCAPNTRQIKFLTKLKKRIQDFCQGHLIMCSDFNKVPDNLMDISSRTNRLSSPMGTFIRNNDLYNMWRCHHTTERDYTFFSYRHNSYTRIDYFLVDKWLLPNITNSTISTISWSDHAPIILTIDTLLSVSKMRIWRANALIPQLPSHSTYTRDRLEEFFELNKGTTSNNATLWNAHKAFIRGILLS